MRARTTKARPRMTARTEGIVKGVAFEMEGWVKRLSTMILTFGVLTSLDWRN
jgi:hypothetical protein